MKQVILIFVLFFQLGVAATIGQTTEFNFQGSLKDTGIAANGNYDFEFRLFDSSGGGSQVGPTISRTGIAVANGIFSVNLDFGGGFPGSDRYLEIRVRNGGGGAFTNLDPRQRVASSPYSIKSLTAESANTAATATNAANAVSAASAVNFTGNLTGDVTGTQAGTTVARLQGRNVSNAAPAGGQVLKFDAGTNQWRPDTDNVGSSGGGTITGVTAGTSLTGGGTTGSVSLAVANSGVGTAQLADGGVTDPKIASVSGAKVTGTVSSATTAGNALQLGGVAATQFVQTTDARLTDSRSPTAGSANYIQNSSNAQAASNFNISGNGTATGTLSAGVVNAQTQYNIDGIRVLSSAGTDNLFAGSGGTTNTGIANSYFGYLAGYSGTSGGENSFFGASAGDNTRTGGQNTFIGRLAGENNDNGSHNTALGYKADIGVSNLVYATAIGADSAVSSSNSIALGRSSGSDTVRVPGNINITGSTSLNGNLTFASGGLASINGTNVFMPSLPAGVGTTLCRSNSNQIITCSSSLRYKTHIGSFNFGLDLIKRLRPITFDWKDGGMHDLGLGAEDVAAIEPLLVTYNDKGQVEGVKYDRIGVVLINAINQQQAQIDAQRKMINELKSLVCARKAIAKVCSGKN